MEKDLSVQDNKEKIKQVTYGFIKANIMNFVVIAISLAYTFYGMIGVEKTDLSLWEVVVKSALSIVVGILIKQGLAENGFSKGYNSNTWKDESDKYDAACNSAISYIDKVDNFYYTEEIEKKKTNRQILLMGARLKYADFFDEDGNFLEGLIFFSAKKAEKIKKKNPVYSFPENYRILTRHQKKVVDKCLNMVIYNLNLFSEYASDGIASSKRETSDKDQRAKMFGKNSISQVCVAIAGAYFIPFFDGWNWAKLIAAAVQVCCFVATGIMQIYINYNYVVVDKVNKLKKKKELIVKFVTGCENGKYQENPYEAIIRKNENLKIEKENALA